MTISAAALAMIPAAPSKWIHLSHLTQAMNNATLGLSDYPYTESGGALVKTEQTVENELDQESKELDLTCCVNPADHDSGSQVTQNNYKELTVAISVPCICSRLKFSEVLALDAVQLTNRNKSLGKDQGDFHILSTS